MLAPSSEQFTELVIAQLRQVLAERDLPESAELGPDTALMGRMGVLDSVALVSLVVGLEASLESDLGVAVSLTDERAFSQRSSPFRTVGSLAAYAAQLAAEVRPA